MNLEEAKKLLDKTAALNGNPYRFTDGSLEYRKKAIIHLGAQLQGVIIGLNAAKVLDVYGYEYAELCAYPGILVEKAKKIGGLEEEFF